MTATSSTKAPMKIAAWRRTMSRGERPAGWYRATRQAGSASPRGTVETGAAASTGCEANTARPRPSSTPSAPLPPALAPAPAGGLLEHVPPQRPLVAPQGDQERGAPGARDHRGQDHVAVDLEMAAAAPPPETLRDRLE